VRAARIAEPAVSGRELAQRIRARFDVAVHPRSIARQLSRQKKGPECGGRRRRAGGRPIGDGVRNAAPAGRRGIRRGAPRPRPGAPAPSGHARLDDGLGAVALDVGIGVPRLPDPVLDTSRGPTRRPGRRARQYGATSPG
jgi:hypothetical protein